MSDKSTIFQGLQIGKEATAGTPVAANKKLLAMSFEFNPKTESDTFRAMGNKYASFVTLNKEWSELGLSGKLTFNEILYALASLISEPTPVQQGSTAAYKWTFTSSTSASDAGKTFTVEQGDTTSAWRSAGVRVAGLTFTFNRKEVSISGSAIGEPIETGITMTASPTSLTPLPVLPTMLTFKMADTQAGLAAASTMTRGFSMTWGLTDKVGLAWPVGQDPVAVETEPKLEGKLRIMTDTTGIGLITTMRAPATKWFRISGIGALIASSYYQTFQLDFPAQISDLGGFSDEDGLHVAEFGLTGIHDATWGKSFQIDVTTDVATI